jgi:uncharacterized protein (DUF1697 family)
MMFDSVPHWFSRRTLGGLKLSNRYAAPPMPFGLTADEGATLADSIPGVRTARDVAFPPGAASGNCGRGGHRWTGSASCVASAPASLCSSSVGRPGQKHLAEQRPSDNQPHDLSSAPATTMADMARYAAFLRGVNVGGVNLKMAEVAKALEDAGFSNVRTILASGNVLLESRAGVEAVRKKAEAALRDAFGYDAWVLAYDVNTVAAISKAFPFEREVEGHHSYVTFVTDEKVLDELAALADDAGPDEKIKSGKGVIYWQVPRTGTLDTTIGKTMGKKRYKSSTTTRNLRTVDKVLR